jgi:EAL domain-containing protein (putative c-di-GMP-specific phosphodiesterase class I)
MTHRTLMHDILAPGGLSVLFQPMIEVVDGDLNFYALEALSRGPKGSNVERADVLFEYIRRKGREIEVDRACVASALAEAARIPGKLSISINVHASTLERDERFVDLLVEACESNGVVVTRIILEIVEQQQYWNHIPFFRTLDRLRDLGVRIALDDIGLGYSNHRMLLEVCPDLFKIDRYFVHGCSERPQARAAIESIVLLASRLGGRVVAEGLETSADFETILSLGIDLVQGYYFARPATAAVFNRFAESQAAKERKNEAVPLNQLGAPDRDPSPSSRAATESSAGVR